jgi:holo-[acyl-carrier protein] synthase
MIVGLGVDLIELARVGQAYGRFGTRFARRILTDQELARFVTKEPVSTLAKYFCAKEAAGKALGTGVMGPVGFKHIIVEHRKSGRPFLRLDGPAQKRLEYIGGDAMHLTISDEKSMAVAMVVIEGPGPLTGTKS